MKCLQYLLMLIILVSSNLYCSTEIIVDEAGTKMQDLVVALANYARSQKENFMVIPQNGVELLFNQQDPKLGFNKNYVQAIDGLGVEELFNNGGLQADDERLDMLKMLDHKPVFVSDFINKNQDKNLASNKIKKHHFIPFVRTDQNYHYTFIPAGLPCDEHNSDVTNLNQVRNYLYLINNERFDHKLTFISAIQATNYDLIIMDLFFNDQSFTSDEINSLKTKANGGKRLVIAYLNIGSAENFRYYWESDWNLRRPHWMQKKYAGYPDEYWVEFWHPQWQKILFGHAEAYLDRILLSGFDGAYLDNVEAYYFLYH